LKLQPVKLKCYSNEAYRDDKWNRLRGSIPNETIADASGNEHHGFSVCNVPIGYCEYDKEYLRQKKRNILKGYNKISTLMDPGRWPYPEIPLRQMLWILLVACLQFMGDYWLRHVRPDFTKEFAAGIDEAMAQLLQTCIGMDTSTWSSIAKQRLRLPIRMKSCGLQDATDRRHAQYIGVLVQSMLPLLDRSDSNGASPKSRLHTPNHPRRQPHWQRIL